MRLKFGKKRTCCVALAIASWFGAQGCSSTGSKPGGLLSKASRPANSDVAPTEPKSKGAPPPKEVDSQYRVAAGDVLQIAKPRSSSMHAAEVRPDGSLLLASGAEIRVDRLTVAEVEQKLREVDPNEYLDCQVSVKTYNSQFLYVYGTAEADSDGPAAVPYRGTENMTDLLQRVSCPKCRQGYRIRVVRPGKTIGSMPEVTAFELDSNLNPRTSEGKQLVLQPSDYVYLEKAVGAPKSFTPLPERPWHQEMGQKVRRLLNAEEQPKQWVRR